MTINFHTWTIHKVLRQWIVLVQYTLSWRVDRTVVIWTCAGVYNTAKPRFGIVNPHMAGADIKAMEWWAVQVKTIFSDTQ